MVDGAIQKDAPTTPAITAHEGEDAESAFFRAFTADAEKPSGDAEDEDKKKAPAPKANAEDSSEETPEDETDEEDGEEADEGEDTEDDADEDDGKRKRVVLEPDAEAFVRHKVDGKEVEIPIKDLARLYGQEAALTRKSQETAAAQKIVDENGARYTAGLEALMVKALERFKPYADINFLALAKDPDISAADLAALQQQATDAYNDVQFLNTKLDETVKEAEQARLTNLKKAAVESWKVLSDPATGIEGWDVPLYNEIRAYTKAQGIPAQTVDELVDPVAMKLLHKAMLYDKGQKAIVKVTKVDKEPKRIIKASTQAAVSKSKGKGTDGAMAKLQASGEVEDAANVFLARMTQT